MRQVRQAVFVGLLVGVLGCGVWGASFERMPPTQALYRPTAYTLYPGELEISVPSILAPFSAAVEFGLTQNIQIGIQPLRLFDLSLGFLAKVGLPLTPDVELGVPLGITPRVSPFSVSWHGGLVVSVQLGGGFTAHGGAAASGGENFRTTAFGIVDYDLTDELKLVGELGIPPLSPGVGVLVRTLGFIDIRVGLSLPFSFVGGVSARF